MKKFKSLILLISIALTTSNIFSQANPSVAILPLNFGGVVAVGATMDVKVTISNTLAGNIVASKLRPVITIPANSTILPDAQQTGLPAGWVIVSNSPATGQIRVCNGSDVIGGNQFRDIIIKVQGTNIGGPTQCQVQINYGGATCAVSGPQPNGNNNVDDFATSSITVISGPLPLTLLSFNATLLNCQPTLKWTTENEINTARFEVEKADANSSAWVLVDVKEARGNAASKTNYSLTDNNINSDAARQLYRLKMIDKDGKFTYSNILPVVTNCKTVQVSVFPNPVQSGKLYVSLTGTSGQAEAILMSVTGQVILRSKVNNGTQMLNVTNIPDGTYILNISDANSMVEKTKVIIQK